jgi:hypothetical protein
MNSYVTAIAFLLLETVGALAQPTDINDIVTCAVNAQHIGTPSISKVISFQNTDPEALVHGLESEIDNTFGHPPSGLSIANIYCELGQDNNFTVARAEVARRDPNNILYSLVVRIDHNPPNLGNRGLATTRLITRSGMDKTYKTDLPVDPVILNWLKTLSP